MKLAAAGRWEQAEPGVKRKIFPPGRELMMMEAILPVTNLAMQTERGYPT